MPPNSRQSTIEQIMGTELSQRQASNLASVMTQTLPEAGMDRMTQHQIEEVLAVSALTAHL